MLQVYFGKTREMVCTLRPPSEVAQMRMPESWLDVRWGCRCYNYTLFCSFVCLVLSLLLFGPYSVCLLCLLIMCFAFCISSLACIGGRADYSRGIAWQVHVYLLKVYCFCIVTLKWKPNSSDDLNFLKLSYFQTWMGTSLLTSTLFGVQIILLFFEKIYFVMSRIQNKDKFKIYLFSNKNEYGILWTMVRVKNSCSNGYLKILK